jgi:REP element-mobilizing transposase RayT
MNYLNERRSIRLKDYDYSQNGYYFVTICTKNKECLFGEIKPRRGVLQYAQSQSQYAQAQYVQHAQALNDYGQIARNELKKTSEIRKNMEIDCYVVMPNHIHAILVIEGGRTHDQTYDRAYGWVHGWAYGWAYSNTPLRGKIKFKSPSNNLGAMIRGYKSTVTKKINELRDTPKQSVWQRNYYEHIIRSEKSLNIIREYIINNPVKWREDMFFKV